MDTDMITYVLSGHELQNDVQTMIQVFLANRHYTRTEEVTDAEICKERNEKRHCFGNALSPWRESFRMVYGL